MSAWVHAYAKLIADVIASDHPKAPATEIRVVSTGILGLHFNLASLAPFLSLDELGPDSKAAAQRLLNSLS